MGTSTTSRSLLPITVALTSVPLACNWLRPGLNLTLSSGSHSLRQSPGKALCKPRGYSARSRPAAAPLAIGKRRPGPFSPPSGAMPPASQWDRLVKPGRTAWNLATWVAGKASVPAVLLAVVGGIACLGFAAWHGGALAGLLATVRREGRPTGTNLAAWPWLMLW